MKASDPPIVVESRVDAPIDEAWRTITEADRMRRWFFEEIASFEPRVGFETVFTVSTGGRDFPHRFRVVEVESPRAIAWDWSYDGHPGAATARFDLAEDPGGGTRVRVTFVVREDFPDDVPEFRRESCVGGWEYFVGERLPRVFGAAGPASPA